MRRLEIVRLKRLGGVFAFVCAITAAQFSNVQFASAASLTWDGSAGDGLFSTAANWNSDAVPVNGDVVTFPSLPGGVKTLNNDLSSLVLGGVTVGQSTPDGTNFIEYTINSLHFGGGAVISQKQSANIYITGSVVADGGLVFDGTGSPFRAEGQDINITFTDLTVQNNPAACSGGASEFSMNWKPSGTVTIAQDSVYGLALGSTASAIVVGTGALLGLPYSTSPVTYAGNITFNGGGATQGPECNQANAYSLTSFGTSVTLSGTITLNAGNILYNIGDGATVTVTGPINGSAYALTNASVSVGTFVNNSSANNSATLGGVQEVPMTTLPAITDSQPTVSVDIASKTIVALDGVRGDVYVQSSAVLKGTGTADTLQVNAGGTVAPGHSPGKLTVLSTLNLYGTYQAEILNNTTYDQIDVGADYGGGGNAVTLDANSILSAVLYDGYSINQGETFTIINNLSTTAVSGTFNNLPEGAQLTVENIVFSISYVGGDGNDVVLTALNTGSDPTPPNTGVAQIIMANPAILAGMGILAAGILFFAARRRHTNKI